MYNKVDFLLLATRTVRSNDRRYFLNCHGKTISVLLTKTPVAFYVHTTTSTAKAVLLQKKKNVEAKTPKAIESFFFKSLTRRRF